jgi:hypothetical protein
VVAPDGSDKIRHLNFEVDSLVDKIFLDYVSFSWAQPEDLFSVPVMSESVAVLYETSFDQVIYQTTDLLRSA